MSDEPRPDPLDLPDRSAADHRPSPVSPEAAFALCDGHAVELPATAQRLRAQRRTPCPVESVLD